MRELVDACQRNSGVLQDCLDGVRRQRNPGEFVARLASIINATTPLVTAADMLVPLSVM